MNRIKEVSARAVIADDEQPLRDFLKSRLSRLWPGLDICGEAGNGIEALSMIRALRPDVAFLDIRMPGLTGMEVAKQIEKTCHVVFITAYEKYAVAAFESEAVDYLLKPLTEERLTKTIRRLQEKLETPDRSKPDQYPDISEVVDRVMAEMNKKADRAYLQWISVEKVKTIRLISVEDICCFHSSEKYTTVITAEGESLIKKPIKELEEELDPNRFWRIHRATIVNVNRIESIRPTLTGKFSVKLKNIPQLFPVSRTYAQLFKRM
ncbi:MAG: LytTR family DNA-binding domain-containing protein [Desulfosalsimonadaceae bacterium]